MHDVTVCTKFEVDTTIRYQLTTLNIYITLWVWPLTFWPIDLEGSTLISCHMIKLTIRIPNLKILWLSVVNLPHWQYSYLRTLCALRHVTCLKVVNTYYSIFNILYSYLCIQFAASMGAGAAINFQCTDLSKRPKT